MEKPTSIENEEGKKTVPSSTRLSCDQETHEEIWATADDEQWSAARRRARGY